MDNQSLIEAALNAREQSYSPYSEYMVGAAICCDSGKVYTGCNVENASYGATICAERNATFQAVANGERRFSKIAIVGGKKGAKELDYAFPCGMCRQVLREFAVPKDMKVLVARSVNDYKEYTLEELLPDSFGPENLE